MSLPRINNAILLAACLVTSFAAGGEPRRITARPGLVELRLEAGADADIAWEARQPATADYRLYEANTVLVTHLVSGQAVFVSDVIDWTAKKRDKTTWIVTIGDGPAPGPGPGPGPDPVTPPLPAFAVEVYAKAKPIGEPDRAAKFASAFRTAIAEIGAGGLTSVAEVQPRINALCKGIAPGSESWRAVGAFVAEKLKPLTSVDEVRAVFDEVALGLEAAAKGQ